MTSAPPGSTVASFTKKAVEASAFVNFAETVMAVATMLARDNPMTVAVVPELTVGVMVDGLPDVPMFAVTFDLKAMMIPYPRAMAIAMAIESVSALL